MKHILYSNFMYFTKTHFEAKTRVTKFKRIPIAINETDITTFRFNHFIG